ncbi:MAG: tetratricopeptide repeat protein [Melioribacteraceae bacterium]|nr:tetratricopeptide repeat protein [Melioribacteraceae bacterium]
MSRIKYYISFTALFIFLQSCGLWENFTTYFNRYYNAKLSLEEAEEIIKNDTKRELFDFKEPNVPSSANNALEKVIEGCSKILQFNKESDYFDAALFMIGKAYYYQGNYTKALRKFNELQTIPESELRLDNMLWVAKSELQMRRFEEGNQLLEEVKQRAESEEREDILFDVYLTQIRYLTYRENYPDAINVVSKLLEFSASDETSAELSYQLGKLYLKLDDYEKAAEAFSMVNEFTPTFDIEFESKLEEARVNKQLGQLDQSIEILDDLASEDKFNDKIDQIELEKADVLYQMNEIQEAFDLYTEVDTSYATRETSGIAAFKRAEIIEKDLGDLDSAEVLYANVLKSRAPLEYKDLARKKSQIFKDLKTGLQNIADFSRQRSYHLDSTLFVRDSIRFADYYTRKDSLDSLVIEMKELQGRDFDSTKFAMNEKPPFKKQPMKPVIPVDTLVNRIVKNKYEVGNLFLGELELPDSAYKYYKGIIEEFPYTRYQPKVLYALGTYYLTKGDKQSADSLFNIVYDNYKEDKIVNAAAEKLGKNKVDLDKDPAEDLFMEAEEMYDSSDFDDAIAQLYRVTETYPESPFSAKSYFTIGYILENKLYMIDSAAVVYDTLLNKYQQSIYANDVRSKLTFYNNEKQKLLDSLALADARESKESSSVSDQVLNEDTTAAKLPDTNDVAEKRLPVDGELPGRDLNDAEIMGTITDTVKTQDQKFKRPGRPRARK